MANILRFLAPNSAVTLRPRLACEILPEGVVAARREGSVEDSVLATYAPLAPGSATAALHTPNLANRQAVVASLRKALDEVASRDRHLTLVIPDAAVRVLILDFDTLPSKAAEVLPVIRFRLRKLVPFEVEHASISYQVVSAADASLVRVLVAIMPQDVLAEYESAVSEAGYEPGVVLSSSLAAAAAVSSSEPALVLNRNGNTVTTVITVADDILLHRTLELPAVESEAVSELQRTVSVAMAYFEDALHTRPQSLFYAGPGGAPALAPMVEEEGLRVRDLVPAPATGATSAVPKGLLSGVVGALSN
ncbi:MAG TPA: hypothetical protein VM554_12155 [Acidisarcina sp.]|nr:hypothetical protein [Acidisarcina sp.]